uniref:Tyrosine specific protein phosphatases domain-containing protein n=1 Tax=Eptatretus burgeri TaxID=7764 RepID=A0A8C4PZF7_EPTBU
MVPSQSRLEVGKLKDERVAEEFANRLIGDLGGLVAMGNPEELWGLARHLPGGWPDGRPLEYLRKVVTATCCSGRVLVHCVMGRSRSATLVLAFLLLRRSLPLERAVRETQCRRNLRPNRAFLAQLRPEKQGYGQSLTSLV